MRNHLHLTDTLNPEQEQAVTALNQNLLVLAGAGSGKTRVLVHRIAWLMQTQAISPLRILAVTFTNKAAMEMRSRIESLCQISLQAMWVGTFHGLAHRLLRLHWKEAGIPENFQIIDQDDQLRLIKRIHKGLGLDEEKWPPKQAQWFINKNKEEGLRPAQVQRNSQFDEMLHRIYVAYEDMCQTGGLIDFTELLLRALELLQKNESVREHYQARFQHILIDEFQDTNTIQYLWLRLLTGADTQVMAVGDDDQSIYSWRGAKVENLERFRKEYAPVQMVRLEQNYRSTANILNAANAVIANNEQRLGKNLWTNGKKGELITLYKAFSERDEANYIISRIRDWHKQGNAYQDCAILYRSNAQSRVLEEALLEKNIPYRVYGGQRFFDRAEIKDALAYLRLVANRQDDTAFERVINTPTRGIGETTLTKIREAARENHTALWDAATFLAMESQGLPTRASSMVQSFLQLIPAIETATKDLEFGDLVEKMLEISTLLAFYKLDRSEQGQSRVENLEEFINAAKQFSPEPSDVTLSPLSAFLSHVALETGESQADQYSDCVSLMTLHAAKGLEFPVVFMAGLEEDLFPHKMSLDEERGLEEERRLCYVGMTRAQQKLYLSFAETRRIYGMEKFHRPSRFLKEIPEELLSAVRPNQRPEVAALFPRYAARIQQETLQRKSAPIFPKEENQSSLQVGMRVRHANFGTGIIVNFEGRGEHARVQVKFDSAGVKWLVASFAKLEIL